MYPNNYQPGHNNMQNPNLPNNYPPNFQQNPQHYPNNYNPGMPGMDNPQVQQMY